MAQSKQKLTEEQKRKYMHGGADRCPFCYSNAISAEQTRHEGLQAWRTVRCETCGESWRDVHILHTVEDVD